MKLNFTLAESLKLLASIAICNAAGLFGTIFTFDAIKNWYADLVKPVFSPPNWVFGPVWTILYVLMGISLYLVWEKSKNYREYYVSFFVIHLVLNAAWSYVFFGLENPFWAFVNIIILWIMIVAMVVMYYRISKWASILLVPYLLWVSFASVLNFAIWQLN